MLGTKLRENMPFTSGNSVWFKNWTSELVLLSKVIFVILDIFNAIFKLYCEVNYIMINSINLCTNHNSRFIRTVDNILGIILLLFLFLWITLIYFFQNCRYGIHWTVRWDTLNVYPMYPITAILDKKCKWYSKEQK